MFTISLQTYMSKHVTANQPRRVQVCTSAHHLPVVCFSGGRSDDWSCVVCRISRTNGDDEFCMRWTASEWVIPSVSIPLI